MLDVQTIDSALAQLEHRRKSLPEHAEINALTAAVATNSADVVAAEKAVSDLEAEQKRAEAEIQPVRERLNRNQTRIADGTIADPKALSSMVEEVAHLQRRISDLEDAELEIMEQLESATTALERLRLKAGELDKPWRPLTFKSMNSAPNVRSCLHCCRQTSWRCTTRSARATTALERQSYASGAAPAASWK